ncbi:MAG TPA: hypothetical protein VLA23_06625 [Candidatus Limnocylindrales bacterium]|nr:hypothetical protein [Candidatus Limnocylindrales bacterium]
MAARIPAGSVEETASVASPGAGAAPIAGRRPPTPLEAISLRTGVPHIVVVLAVTCLLGLPLMPYVFPGRERELFTSVFLPHLGRLDEPLDAVYQVLVIATVVFSPLATSYMLDRVWRTPARAPWLGEAITPEVEATVASGRRLGPPFVIGALVLLPMLVQYLLSGYVQSTADAAVAALEVAVVLLRFAVLFSFVWCYIRSLVGLARICALRLDLLPSYQDPWLGTRPLGSLALSLSAVYSVGLALGVSITIAAPAAAIVVPLVVGLFLLGALLFFLPLRSVHRQMAQEKASEEAWVREQLASLVAVSRRQAQPVPSDPTTALQRALTIDLAERHVAAIRTWPIDMSIAVRLATSIALPLTLTLAGRQLMLSVLGV